MRHINPQPGPKHVKRLINLMTMPGGAISLFGWVQPIDSLQDPPIVCACACADDFNFPKPAIYCHFQLTSLQIEYDLLLIRF